MKLLPPTTFAEGQRAIALWLRSAAGAFYGFGTALVILLLWLGGWSVRSEAQRLSYIAFIGIAYALGSTAVTLALAVGGPVGRFKAAAGRDGVSVDLDDRDDKLAPTVTTTTEVRP